MTSNHINFAIISEVANYKNWPSRLQYALGMALLLTVAVMAALGMVR